MDNKGIYFLTSLLMLIPLNEGFAQETGGISINQDFRKPAEGEVASEPDYTPYPFHDDSPEKVEPTQSPIAEEPTISGPVIEPPIPTIDEPKLPPVPDSANSRPSVGKLVTSAPTNPITPKPAPIELARKADFNNFEERPSVIAIPRPPSPPVAGPSPIREPVQFPAAAVAQPKPEDIPSSTEVRIPTLTALRGFSWRLSQEQLKYKFGRNHPTFGGLDSSGAIQFVLKETGLTGVPRTTKGLNSWARENAAVHDYPSRPSVNELVDTLEPGNLIFWGDLETRKLTHVMIYMGFDVQRGHLAFGTRGGIERGVNNSEVDIFPLHLDRERIIATGRIPGLIRR